MKNGLIVKQNGQRLWYKDNKLHKEDGPAVESPNGDKFWYKNDKLHREDGPAIERSNGDKFWYLNDKEYSEEIFNIKIIKDDLPLINDKKKLKI